MRPRVVICGTYHHDTPLLKRTFLELEMTGCHVLSPLSIDFIDTTMAVVRTANDYDLSIDDLERFHLRALRDADFVWLHCPHGHSGLSAAYELGYSSALRKPTFCFTAPKDEMLATRVRVVGSVFEALELMRASPSSASAMQ
ncbi:MAG TPA: hypothetical protein VLI54_05775 [Bacillota bacterium]|nr:hypothetical protein [Bacillota bacterium]